MKKQKSVRILCGALTAALLLAFGLAGCQAGKDGSSSAPAASDTQTPADTTGNTPETTPADTQAEATQPDPTDSTTPADPTDGTEPGTDPTQAPANGGNSAVAALAAQLEGKTFKWGATGPDEFDNSGLLYYCYKENNITVPRLTSDMAKAGTEVAKADLQPGDAVFFSNTPGENLAFAGIYLGNGKFIASANETRPVTVYTLSSTYWTERYITARRFA